jgi:lysophospholipase L1-like esterase
MSLLSQRGRWCFWGCGLVVLTLFATCLTLIWLAREWYARELSVRLWAGAPPRLVQAGRPDGLRVLFLGDSRAAAWPNLPADRFFTLHAGAPGETTAQIRLHAEADMRAAKPAVVVFQAGINDLKAIGVFPGSAADIQRVCASNICEIVRICQRHRARVILTLIIPPGKVSLARRLVWSPLIPISVREVNAWLTREFAQTEGVDLLDAGMILRGRSSGENDFSDYLDTLHLAPSGYGKIEPELRRLIEQNGSLPSVGNSLDEP